MKMPVRAPGKARTSRIAPPSLFARISSHITLEPRADGSIAACFHGQSVGLGTFSVAAAERARELRTGLPFGSIKPGAGGVDKEVDRLVRRLARSGLLEYRLGQPREGADL